MALPVLLAGLVLLAGCTLPGDEAEEPDLFGVCPQWVGSDQVIERSGEVGGRIEFNLSAEPVFQNRSLDMYLLEVQGQGLRVQAFLESGARVGFHLVEGDALLTPPTLEVQGTQEARVFLSPVEQGAPPAPGDLRLVIEGQGDVSVTAKPFYRVCGVLLA